MRYPAEHYVKFLILSRPGITDDQILAMLDRVSFLMPELPYLTQLRGMMGNPPDPFFPADPTNESSARYLRDQEVYAIFHPDAAMEEAWGYLRNPAKSLAVEQLCIAELELSKALIELNKRTRWDLTVSGVERYRHFFFNRDLLSFDEWGRFLYGRHSMYERYISILQGDHKIAEFALRINKEMDSKQMVKETQAIAFAVLAELNQLPGVRPDKVRGIALMAKVIHESDEVLSTSGLALKETLKQFNHFRMQHMDQVALDIAALAPEGTYSGSGATIEAEVVKEQKKLTH